MTRALGAFAALALATSPLTAPACGEEDAVTLPADWNTLKSRQIVVSPFEAIEAPLRLLVPLNGIDGAPAPLHPELPDLRVPYWRKTGATDDPDGARLDLVRVGSPDVCALSLDGLYPDPAASPDVLASYDLAVLDRHMASVAALGGAHAVFRADFARDPSCGGHGDHSALADPALWAKVTANVVQHLVSTGSWNPGGVTAPVAIVEIFGAPEALIDVEDDGAVDDLIAAWIAVARRVRAASPAADYPDLRLSGLAFPHTSPLPLEADDPDAPPAERPPILRFIDACAADDAPLDVLAVRARVARPYEVARIAAALRAYLDAAGLPEVALMVTEMAPREPAPYAQPSLNAAYLGAFEAATRIFLQDVPVRWALSGRGPQVFTDGATHADEPLATLTDLLAPSAYFDLDGVPTPAFMARLPVRQLLDHERVVVSLGPDQDGMAVLAARPADSARRLTILIANAGDDGGAASITYDLRIPSFVPPAVRRVDLRVATLDHRNEGLASFFFSEVGDLTPSAADGTVRLVRELPIPGVHYIEIEQALPQ